MLKWLFSRWGKESPADLARAAATPQEVIRQHFEAMAAHDLDGILATLAPQRARLYSDPRTLDKYRRTVSGAEVLGVETVSHPLPAPGFSEQYPDHVTLKVEFDLHLVEPEQRRDPTLREGRQWSYYILVRKGPGKPWLIADWGL